MKVKSDFIRSSLKVPDYPGTREELESELAVVDPPPQTTPTRP